MTRARRRGGSAGIMDLPIVALALPIVLLLMAATADLSRVPISRSLMADALEESAYGAERELFAHQDPAAPVLTSDAPLTANALCGSRAGSAGGCESPILPSSFLTPRVASELARAAGERYRALAVAAPSFFGIARADHWAVCFAVVRLPVDSRSGALRGAPEIVGERVCAGTTELSDEAGKRWGLEPASIAAKLAERLRARADDAAAWMITDGGPGEAHKTSRAPYLSSYWLVGTANTKLSFIFGDFFRSNSLVGDYFVRPFENPAGIERVRS